MKTWIISAFIAIVAVAPAIAQDMAGRAVLVVGQAYATDGNGAQRSLRKGDAVFPGDTITTLRHSYVNVVYTDDGRTLIGPNSQLRLTEYSYRPMKSAGPRGKTLQKRSADGRSVFSLLRGGFRAVTGLIGKSRKESYSIRTAVATIGIRGTDAVYIDCTDGRCGDLGPGGNQDPNSVVIGVYEGGISAILENGKSMDVDPGQFVQATKFGFNKLAGMPGILLTMPMADPNSCE